MFDCCFKKAHVQRRLKANPWAKLLRDYATYLRKRGHRPTTRQLYIRSVEHFLQWLAAQGYSLAEIDEAIVRPRAILRTAIGYTLSNWDALVRYTEDGDLDIDNNEAENAVRSIALGRNYAESSIMRSKEVEDLVCTRT